MRDRRRLHSVGQRWWSRPEQRRWPGSSRVLEQVLEVTVLTPRDPESSTGVVTAGLAGWAGRELIDTLRRRWRVTGRSAYGDRAARFSLALCFIAEAVVETRSEAMRQLARWPRPATAPGQSLSPRDGSGVPPGWRQLVRGGRDALVEPVAGDQPAGEQEALLGEAIRGALRPLALDADQPLRLVRRGSPFAAGGQTRWRSASSAACTTSIASMPPLPPAGAPPRAPRVRLTICRCLRHHLLACAPRAPDGALPVC